MRPLTTLGVGVVTALLLVACGSDSDQLSEEEFLAKANEICRIGNEEDEQLANDISAAMGEEPTEEEIQEFVEEEGQKFLDASVSNTQGQTADVRDLNGPDDLEDELNPLLDQISEITDGVAKLSPEEFFAGEGQDEIPEIITQIQALGLTTCGGVRGGDEEFCAAAEEFEATDALEGDPETLDERLDQAESNIAALVAAAPDEISQEIDVAAAGFGELVDLLRAVDDPTDEAQVEAAFEQVFDDDEFIEADQTFNAYIRQECGIVPE